MAELYPLKFEPRLKKTLWGGNALVSRYHKKGDPDINYGESWELSAVSGNLSIVSNGFLAGNNIEELIEVYMGDLTGDLVYEKFGNEFPLLIKLIEARQDLSIQVHPGNDLAKLRHNAYGKTEMWYVLESEPDSLIYSGFKRPVSRDEYILFLNEGKIDKIMNFEHGSAGDVFFIPAGRVHSLGAGNIIAEIQQTSDITYRIFDWNRKDSNGKERELHTELALEAIDFNAAGNNKITPEITSNVTGKCIHCEFFNTNILSFDQVVSKDYAMIDSFIIYICVNGEFNIRWEGNAERVLRGETVLIPAMIKELTIEPSPQATLLEIFMHINNQ